MYGGWDPLGFCDVAMKTIEHYTLPQHQGIAKELLNHYTKGQIAKSLHDTQTLVMTMTDLWMGTQIINATKSDMIHFAKVLGAEAEYAAPHQNLTNYDKRVRHLLMKNEEWARLTASNVAQRNVHTLTSQ